MVDLRKKAALFRRIANIRTIGGGSADHVLLHLADRLDHDAAAAERENAAPKEKKSTRQY
jgi:hypothetical protein